MCVYVCMLYQLLIVAASTYYTVVTTYNKYCFGALCMLEAAQGWHEGDGQGLGGWQA